MAKKNFDLFFDKLETKLKAYSTGQTTDYKFTVEKDFLKIKQSVQGAYIYLNFSGIIPTETARNIWQHKATYNLDCIAIYKDQMSATADERANARLRYLVGQVLEAVLDPEARDLGMTPGTVTNIRVESVTAFPIELVTELGHQGQRIVISAEFEEAYTATGTPLEELNVTAPLWSAVFENE